MTDNRVINDATLQINIKKSAFQGTVLMKKTLLTALCMISPFAFSANEVVYLHYDETVDGANDYQNHIKINVDLSGNLIIGKTEDGSIISGVVENASNSYIGSGDKPRFRFEIHQGDTRNWYFGRIENNYWEGVWYGPSGQQGDFTFHSDVLTKDIPTFKNITSYYADNIFDVGDNSVNNTLNSNFLVDTDNLEPIYEAEFSPNTGIFVQTDTGFGGTPFPMSFYLDFNKPLKLKTFRLGSFNNGEGTRLTSFTVDAWKDGVWETVGSYQFAPIEIAPFYQRQEFTLPHTTYTDRIRISAKGTSDLSAGGKVVMWGLSFK
ncbi:hypothetical protein GCM10007978_04340 [Shewanella hanedai]|nr:hypothetical protein GCM10007978_04340 [Shewanella hanedai]